MSGARPPGPSIHATCLAIGEAGVLIRGASGAGKSALALALLDHCEARARPAWLVADDRVHLRVDDSGLLAACPPALQGLIERRGFGLVRRPFRETARLRLVADLVPFDAMERLPSPEARRTRLEGVAVARIAVPREDRGAAVGLVLACLDEGEGADPILPAV